MKYLFTTLMLVCVCVCVCAQEIKYTQIKDDKSRYFVELIELALDKAQASSQFKLNESSKSFNQQQQVERLNTGELSIMWAGTQPEYESNLLPIRIPLMKGLQGHRLFLIHAEQQNQFSQVHSINDLRKLRAGQGRFWGDTNILKHSGMPVVTPVKKESLFYMLDGGRFDYLPLGVHEPWDEVHRRDGLSLAVEQNILLIYPMPMYFFVAKDNAALRDLIERGLETAIADGSFDQLFYNAPHVKNALDKANLAARTVIRIPNPNLHQATPLDRPELWLQL
ncbi:diguanylate cyclase (plasmid) [Catenovulum sp. SX2]|uniref:diguanylate cyclase n=1 Tax=Catenovulum sp. SX2 TaxID=3398614 RepID=UPI003F83BB60